ncbi:MAG: phosphatidate cytidylyltransferase [archaeon]
MKFDILGHDSRRKLVHIGLGTLFVVFIPFIAQERYILILLGMMVLALLLSIFTKYKKPKLIINFLKYFDKPKDLANFPGKGAVYYLISAFIAISLFEKNIASAALIILAVGDPAAYFFGRYYGKNKIIINPRKLLEGTLAGIFFGTLAASLFIPFKIAFFGAVAGMIAEAIDLEGLNLDDNLTIPLTAGLVLSYFLR